VCELWVVGSGCESVSVVNIDRLLAGTLPHTVAPVFLAGRVPNAIAFHEGRGYIVNSQGNSLTIFNLHNPALRTEVFISAGANPWSVAIVRQGAGIRALVPCFMENTLAVVRVEENNAWLEGKVPLARGTRPAGIVSNGEYAWIAMTGFVSFGNFDQGYVLKLDVRAEDIGEWEEAAYAESAMNPQSLALDASGNKVYVLSTGNYDDVHGQLEVFAADTLAPVDACALAGSAGSLVLDAAADRVYVAGWGYLACYGASDLTEQFPQAFANFLNEYPYPGIAALAFDPENRLLFAADGSDVVTAVFVFDLEADTFRYTLSFVGNMEYLTALAWVKVEAP